MSRVCLVCQENETAEGTHRKVCEACYENAGDELERHVELYVAAPALAEQLQVLVDMARSAAGNWENGNLADAVRNLQRVADEAETLLATIK